MSGQTTGRTPGRRDVRPLRVSEVTVRFGGLVAVNRVSFTVEPGSIHALIGPNGAGKSTCFNAISGVCRISSGRITLGDVDLGRTPPHRIAALGVGRAFQNLALSPTSTVFDNVMLGRHALTGGGFLGHGLRAPWLRRAARRHADRVAEICDFLGVARYLHTPAGVLPYGDQKRVDIARALAVEPTLLMLDEPAAGMNASETAEMAALIQDVRDELGVSVLFVEHDMGLVMGIADRVTVLDFGRLIADDVPSVVQRAPEVIAAYLGVDDGQGQPAVKTRAGGGFPGTGGGNGDPATSPRPGRDGRAEPDSREAMG
ncbi:ABC transporter ATP-binding protein [Gandjariella thermophila]|uniref:ABC transporter ATP-binding protein n=1 Tax=Gandjariella thermophila TaxID=1931992 RepID=A0A4D4JII3_9PSEU|nr:ABC transporter ATP-binding protein [Gandjariella thermophila]GDY33703.1 ABC transporter ATP-binding protein [Gandjariella thermophila]